MVAVMDDGFTTLDTLPLWVSPKDLAVIRQGLSKSSAADKVRTCESDGVGVF